MKTEAQRIAIAEACGAEIEFEDGSPVNYVVWPEKFRNQDGYSFEYAIPHYPSDLNAMHEAAKILPAYTEGEGPDRVIYHNEIVNILRHTNGTGPFGYEIIEATASQRAEAFLKTITTEEKT